MHRNKRNIDEVSTLTSVLIVLPIVLTIGTCSRDEDKVYSGSWKVEYEYEDRMQAAQGIASGAKAVGENGVVLAKAKLLGLVSDENRNLMGLRAKVEETHYDLKGRVKYRCISLYDFPLGRKSSETASKGIRHTDYFSTWPVWRSPMGTG